VAAECAMHWMTYCRTF